MGQVIHIAPYIKKRKKSKQKRTIVKYTGIAVVSMTMLVVLLWALLPKGPPAQNANLLYVTTARQPLSFTECKQQFSWEFTSRSTIYEGSLSGILTGFYCESLNSDIMIITTKTLDYVFVTLIPAQGETKISFYNTDHSTEFGELLVKYTNKQISIIHLKLLPSLKAKRRNLNPPLILYSLYNLFLF